ncbi:MAG: DUF3387 domain-containing protein [Azoarcus sp.]|jgi:hypothetical protein|nr:DUF3387 domain-containing protein [Azoarcus sp.]
MTFLSEADTEHALLAQLLLVSLRENVSVDWARRDSARARMRVLVKRILRKYGYPPDMQDTAVRNLAGWMEYPGFYSWLMTHSHNPMPIPCCTWKRCLRLRTLSIFPTRAGVSRCH